MRCRGWSATLALVVAVGAACTAGSAGSGGTQLRAPDARNATYRIGTDVLSVSNGRLERDAAPGSASKIVTTVTDVQATGDMDADGRPDTVVVLVDQPGGSGSFYYLAVLLNPTSGVTTVPAVLLGDRITVNGLKVDAKAIVVDMLDRAAGQPMTSSPGVSVTKRFALDAGGLKPQ